MWHPDSMRQKLADYTLKDILNLPPDAPRVELVNGVMLVVPSPTEDHQNIPHSEPGPAVEAMIAKG
jgi:hypothetical protein